MESYAIGDVRKPGFFEAIWSHLKSWSAEYSVLLLTVSSVYLAAIFYYLLTGRRPEEDLSWMTGFSANCVKIALAITFTSAARQAFGVWYLRDQLVNRPAIAGLQTFSSLTIFLACLYALSH